MTSKSANRYPPELRERAVRMLPQHLDEYDSETDVVRTTTSKMGAITIPFAHGRLASPST